MFVSFLSAASSTDSMSNYVYDAKKSRYNSQFLICIFLFFTVFLILGLSVNEIWFREDDLGTILNGRVSSLQSFIKVFLTDVRDFICPINYRRSAPNFLSGFLRPLQHFLFTIEYYFFGNNAYPYFIVHVALHSFNAVLLYLISVWFLPIFPSICVALFFAFYPDVSWLTWIATAQNTLCTLFLLASIICWKYFLIFKKNYLNESTVSTFKMWIQLQCSGVLFFLSLLARENVVAMPLWFFVAAYVFFSETVTSKFVRIKYAFFSSMPFFVAVIIYWILRFWAFGFGTLSRTLGNIVLRFPFISSLINFINQKIEIHLVATKVVNNSVEQVVQVLKSTSDYSFVEQVFLYLNRICTFFTSWLSSVLMIDFSFCGGTVGAIFILFFCTIFFIYSYRKNIEAFILLLLGIVLMSWPALVAYPCPRYLNTIYPFVSLLFIGACFLGFNQKKYWLKWCSFFCAMFIFCISIRGILLNRKNLYEAAKARADYKLRFDLFFTEHNFESGAKFIVISSPFVSDIQSIFQVYLNDYSASVAHEPFSTIAEGGNFGCNNNYKTKGVNSRLVPIDGGFQFVSDDYEHCAWWIHFSDHPIAWSEKDRAYAWTGIRYQEGIWYQCSIGKFKINKMIDDRRLVDVSFIFDKNWINEKTVVVAWDTLLGRYFVLDIKHIFK